MGRRFNEAIDNTHDIIYYTDLEKSIINTPVFQRLHDVNQSSTLYFTFATNRTKRYEHSLGVMQIASDMLYRASVNSSKENLDYFLNEVSDEFKKVFLHISRNNNCIIDGVSEKIKAIHDEVIDILPKGNSKNINDTINQKFIDYFADNCLINLVPRGIEGGYNIFLYCCMLQSIRVVGLLHDIGHPPQSHIVEKVLDVLYSEYKNKDINDRNDRQEHFVGILARYYELESENISEIDKKMAIETCDPVVSALHEMIGLQFVRQIFNWITPEVFGNWVIKEESNNDINLCKFFYYYTIIEFVFAILRDKNPLFKNMHRIIDGTIDADRMDFIKRDALNAGVGWKTVPYKQIVNTCMLKNVDSEGGKEVRLCFSDKCIPDIDSVLVNRYKDYSLLNYHHRSCRIAYMYQKSVEIICRQYLSNAEQDSEKNNQIINDISGLWRNLELGHNMKNAMLSLIQWNDAWLNSLLMSKMVSQYYRKSYGKSEDKRCIEYLKEIFLNEGKHISVVKRQMDVMQINEAIWNEVRCLKKKIQNEIENRNDDVERNKMESIVDSFDKPLDWQIWIDILDGSFLVETIEKTLSDYKNVQSYFVVPVDFSIGAKMDEVFIFDATGKAYPYELFSNVDQRLESERQVFPHFYIYIKTKRRYKNIKKQVEYYSELRRTIGQNIGKELNNKIKNMISK